MKACFVFDNENALTEGAGLEVAGVEPRGFRQAQTEGRARAEPRGAGLSAATGWRASEASFSRESGRSSCGQIR